MLSLLLIMKPSGFYHRWVFGILLAAGLGWGTLAVLATWDSCYGVGSQRAPGLTREALFKIRVDMTEGEVIALIGQPLEKIPPSKGSRGRVWSWSYAEPGLVETGIGVGVGFRDHRVIRVAADIRDLGVYLCTEEKCPNILRGEGLSCIPER
jgi:hypothetical protein